MGCRTVQPKRQMVRVVHTTDGVFVDRSGKLAGRGAYLHESRDCWERGLKGNLVNALKTELSPDDRVRLETFMNSLPQEAGNAGG